MEEVVRVKDEMLLLPLIEMIKIDRLTSLLPDKSRLSSPKTRLRHGRRLTLLSHLNNPKFVYSLLCSVTGSFSSFSSSSLTKDAASVFPSSAEPRTLMSLICFSAAPSPSLNFSRLPQTFLFPLPLV